MKRVAIFSMLGLALAGVPLLLLPLPVAGPDRIKISVRVSPFSFGFTLLPSGAKSLASDPFIGDRTDRLEDWMASARL